MNPTHLTLAAVLMIGTVQPVSAGPTAFDFSYQFGSSNHLVTGSISGTLNDNATPGNAADDYVEGITVLSAFYDGAAFSGPSLFVSAYNYLGWMGGPVHIAFAAASNNFLLANCDGEASCLAGYADPGINVNYFLMRTPGQGGTAASFYSEDGRSTRDDPVNVPGWSLTAQAAAVPEPGTYALVCLGLGALGLAQRRRRSRD